MELCSRYNNDAISLTISRRDATIASSILVLVIAGILYRFITSWWQTRQQTMSSHDVLTKMQSNVDDLVDSIVPHLLVHQQLYRMCREEQGVNLSDDITYVDMLIARISSAMGPVCEKIREADKDSIAYTREDIRNLLGEAYIEICDGNIIDNWNRFRNNNGQRTTERLEQEDDDSDATNYAKPNEYMRQVDEGTLIE